jgi:hypothetical protein
MSISRWLLDHPRLLERAYLLTEWALRKLEPLLRRFGLRRFDRPFRLAEIVTKGPIFDCRMCGVCNLRGTGMTCPMTCPKELRNGPCGGVRQDGTCEILPDMECIWALAWDRSENMRWYGERIFINHPPLDHRLWDTSAWVNYLEDRDCCAPPGWPDVSIPHPGAMLRRRPVK